ncbi:MAG: cysteine desulfurase [Patescibacteria group bacterium]|nr:cysteine desulfurase [Patescibacteria group bacterium]
MFIPKKSKQLIYFDYAAATPLDPAVLSAMRPYYGEEFGNPSALYQLGARARSAVERSRKTVANLIGARPSEVVFTAGGTESCNLAIFGIAAKYLPLKKFKPHIIITAVEHHAVLMPVEELKRQGCQVTVLPVDQNGLIDVTGLQKAIRPNTVLISVMYANNEIGTIQPIAVIGKFIARANIERAKKKLPQVVFHSDACQAPGLLDINVQKLGVDLMSVNGSKIYGPKQTGFLFVRDGVNLKPLIYGGGQEKDLRSGTENVAGIVGLTKALKLAIGNREVESRRLVKLQNYFFSRLTKIKGVALNGPIAGFQRLPNNVNIRIKGVEGEALMLYLDAQNVAVSTGSACATSSAEASHVLLAIGLDKKQAKSSIRISMGKSSTKGQIDYLLEALPSVVKKLRTMKYF